MRVPGFGSAVEAEAEASRGRSVIGGAGFALGILFTMNLLNYVDRYVFSSVFESIRLELHLSDAKMGVLGSSFMVVYTLVSPIMGILGDRYDRRRLLAFGVGLWSIATVGTAFAQSYSEMFFWRAVLGVGEASYGVIAPARLSDLFTPKKRGKVIGIFYLALPVGTALGFALGGLLSRAINWRAAFMVVGVPGLVVALLGLRILDPGRGASEGSKKSVATRPRLRDYLQFFQNRSFLFNTAGMAGVAFATGAVALYGSAFYQRVHGLSERRANIWLGVLLALGGLVGIALGTWFADVLAKRTQRAYLLWATIAVAGAIPAGIFGLLSPGYTQSFYFLFVCSVLLSSVLGPCNTVTANVVPAAERATGYALSIFLLHVFGDISSQLMVGHLSDWLAHASTFGSPVARLFESVGALPISGTNLRGGLLALVPALGLSTVFFALGSLFLARDQDRARLASAGVDVDEPVLGH